MVNFMIAAINTGVTAPIYGYFIFSIFTIFIYQYARRRSLAVTPVRKGTFWCLFLSGLLMAVRYPSVSDFSLSACLVLYCVNPAVIFMAGYALTHCSSEGERAIRNALCAIATGCAMHVFLNIIANLGKDRWHTVDFFSAGEHMSATNLGGLNTFIFAILPCVFISSSKMIRIGGTVFFVLSLVYSFILGTRMQLLIVLVIVSLSACLYLKEHYAGKVPKRKVTEWMLGFLLLMAAGITLYHLDVLGIKEKILASNLFYRFVDTDTAKSDSYRWQLFLSGLRNLVFHPLGGDKDAYYFHNYWLDIGRVAGIIPVMLMAVYDITVFGHVIKIFRKKAFSEELRYAFLFLHIGFFMNFFMEPIMDGYISLFYRFCLVNGLAEGLYSLKGTGRREVYDEGFVGMQHYDPVCGGMQE